MNTEMIKERLTALRREMKKRNISFYMIPTADFHESEYVGEYFKARKFITGFTGSAGVALVSLEEAHLWTDGRYFLQAGKQLEGTTVLLEKMGEEGVPTIQEFLKENMKEGQTLGFDGRVVNASLGKELEQIAEEKKGSVHSAEDLVDLIWKDRPELSAEPAWVLEEKYAGRTCADKLSDVRETMKEKGADIHLLSDLCDICWLLNVRGNDIESVPVVLSYLALTEDSCIWFVQEKAVLGISAYLKENKIEVRPYQEFYAYVEELDAAHKILLDQNSVNYEILSRLKKASAGIGTESDPADRLVQAPNPEGLMRAMKNPVEVENIRKAHLKDAVAVCKFMYWLKTNVGKISMTEISVSDYLESLRAGQEGFVEISFSTICGYADHGAIVHYGATPESDRELKAEGLLLLDSGGHYLEGTTDITRTFALGPVTEEEKEHFTLVCRSNINLQAARFKYGCTGRNLDVIARSPFWEEGLDYNHGTGHGVGYLMNVHEGPNGFRYQYKEGLREAVLEEGMVTTDEPGVYIAGKHGVRLESELITRKGEKNEYGQFMYFENITYVPMDLDALLPERMTAEERKRLNDYHQMVYEKVSPYLNKEEAEFLRNYTRAV